MKYLFKPGASGLLMAMLLYIGGTQTALADGTASGVSIANTATVNYEVSNVPQTAVQSSPDGILPPGTATTFLVDNKVDLTVVADTANLAVSPGAADQPLQFTITNTGNTTQGYSLAVVDGGANAITMGSVEIWIDNTAGAPATLGVYDAGDILYIAAANAGDLNPNGTIGTDDVMTVFIVSDTPLTPADGSVDTYNLVATTADAGVAVNSLATTTVDTVANAADSVEVAYADGAGTVDAANDGTFSAAATYTVTSATLAVTKAAVVDDGLGGTYAIPGAIVTYTITVANTGGTAATSVVIGDAIPVNTTYVAESITLDTVVQTDAEDSLTPVDNSDFDVTTAGSVTVTVPTLAAAGTSTITFQVTID